jgi:predicted RNase H-like nuclease (RuvC/YqgF family)
MDYKRRSREKHDHYRLAKFADELVHITEELRRTADVIEMIESEPALIGALMDSGDWRKDEITQLRRHVTDLRVRIGLRA